MCIDYLTNIVVQHDKLTVYAYCGLILCAFYLIFDGFDCFKVFFIVHKHGSVLLTL